MDANKFLEEEKDQKPQNGSSDSDQKKKEKFQLQGEDTRALFRVSSYFKQILCVNNG